MAIGVYDSGVGGLTVYKAISAKFPQLDLIYLGDSARVPYGSKSPETIIKYSLECATELSKRYKLDAFVTACNTVSSHAIPHLEDALGIPVLGVITPGAKHAADVTKNDNICVLGTYATINSGSYIKALHGLCDDRKLNIFQQACPLFVPLAEEALDSGIIAETVVSETLKPLSIHDIDTVILGCTHYPILKDLIQQSFPKANVIDSTEYITRDILDLGINLSENGLRELLVTDESQALHTLKTKLVGNASIKTIQIG